MACTLTRKIYFVTKKDYISQSTQSHRDSKIIKYFYSVFPVVSACPVDGNHRTGVREKYSAVHNIMNMNKSEKRLTVNCEP